MKSKLGFHWPVLIQIQGYRWAKHHYDTNIKIAETYHKAGYKSKVLVYKIRAEEYQIEMNKCAYWIDRWMQAPSEK